MGDSVIVNDKERINLRKYHPLYRERYPVECNSTSNMHVFPHLFHKPQSKGTLQVQRIALSLFFNDPYGSYTITEKGS